jgi:hypothetical protein
MDAIKIEDWTIDDDGDFISPCGRVMLSRLVTTWSNDPTAIGRASWWTAYKYPDSNNEFVPTECVGKFAQAKVLAQAWLEEHQNDDD